MLREIWYFKNILLRFAVHSIWLSALISMQCSLNWNKEVDAAIKETMSVFLLHSETNTVIQYLNWRDLALISIWTAKQTFWFCACGQTWRWRLCNVISPWQPRNLNLICKTRCLTNEIRIYRPIFDGQSHMLNKYMCAQSWSVMPSSGFLVQNNQPTQPTQEKHLDLSLMF